MTYGIFRSNTNPFQKYLILNEQSPTFTPKRDLRDLHQQFLTRKKICQNKSVFTITEI